MTETLINGFPAHKLTEAREALAKLQKRLVRAAAKAGELAPVAPILTVANTRIVSTCTNCKVSEDGWAGGTCIVCKEGYLVSREVLDLVLVAPKPALAGWEFLAVVEPLEGGNLIRKVPGADTEGVDFSPWHTGCIECDHCKTVRKRTETFLVRKLTVEAPDAPA